MVAAAGLGIRGALKLSIRVAVLECGEQSHVAATSSSFSSSSTTFPSLLRGKSGSPEVRLSEAQSGGACGPEEVRADGTVDPAGPRGRQLMTAEASATLVAKDKGRLLRRRSPRGPAEVCAPPSGPRQCSILFLLCCWCWLWLRVGRIPATSSYNSAASKG